MDTAISTSNHARLWNPYTNPGLQLGLHHPIFTLNLCTLSGTICSKIIMFKYSISIPCTPATLHYFSFCFRRGDVNFDRALYPCAAVSAAAKAQKVTVDKRKLLQESGGETKVPQLFKDQFQIIYVDRFMLSKLNLSLTNPI